MQFTPARPGKLFTFPTVTEAWHSRGMIHIPTILGCSILFGICYMLSKVTLTGMQMLVALSALAVVSAATVAWYMRTQL